MSLNNSPIYATIDSNSNYTNTNSNNTSPVSDAQYDRYLSNIKSKTFNSNYNNYANIQKPKAMQLNQQQNNIQHSSIPLITYTLKQAVINTTIPHPNQTQYYSHNKVTTHTQLPMLQQSHNQYTHPSYYNNTTNNTNTYQSPPTNMSTRSQIYHQKPSQQYNNHPTSYTTRDNVSPTNSISPVPSTPSISPYPSEYSANINNINSNLTTNSKSANINKEGTPLSLSSTIELDPKPVAEAEIQSRDKIINELLSIINCNTNNTKTLHSTIQSQTDNHINKLNQQLNELLTKSTELADININLTNNINKQKNKNSVYKLVNALHNNLNKNKLIAINTWKHYILLSRQAQRIKALKSKLNKNNGKNKDSSGNYYYDQNDNHNVHNSNPHIMYQELFIIKKNKNLLQDCWNLWKRTYNISINKPEKLILKQLLKQQQEQSLAQQQLLQQQKLLQEQLQAANINMPTINSTDKQAKHTAGNNTNSNDPINNMSVDELKQLLLAQQRELDNTNAKIESARVSAYKQGELEGRNNEKLLLNQRELQLKSAEQELKLLKDKYEQRIRYVKHRLGSLTQESFVLATTNENNNQFNTISSTGLLDPRLLQAIRSNSNSLTAPLSPNMIPLNTDINNNNSPSIGD